MVVATRAEAKLNAQRTEPLAGGKADGFTLVVCFLSEQSWKRFLFCRWPITIQSSFGIMDQFAVC